MNADGSASRRVYDAHTGRKIGDTQYQPGDFSAVFADDIKSGVRLHTTLDLEQLEEWASELPMTELDELHADLKKALREAPVETQPSHHPPPARIQSGVTTNHVEADVLICPVERSSTRFWHPANKRSFAPPGR